MSIAEQIYELVKTLPQDQASVVLAFAESVRSEYLNTHQAANPEVSWTNLVYSLSGAWKDDFPDLQDIRTESGQDSPRENL